ncbi:hypothetical protein [Rhizobium sp. BK176]|uniref:hypothetical protein n=1 Tax=Rhizobium sp. BK176 TaxID=2587071 RepID=UPI00216A460D|nr:hypothetical protein [Rhizobium sp. BK176]MCS4090115.1 hypothetical protein [Rhizobium sp. BK176]
MRRNVKFPALMAARPPKHKNPKIAVCAFDTVVDLAEVSPSEFPVAIVTEHGTSKTEYRFAGGKLYRSCHTDVDRFIERHQRQFIDSRRGNYVTGHIVRGMYRDVKNINDYAEDKFWPKSALHLLKSGMNSEWQDVRDIVEHSPNLDLWGEWQRKLPEIKHMQFLVGNPDQRLARYERMTQEAFNAFRVMDGHVWAETHEPCYVAQMLPEGIGHLMIGNVESYVRNDDTSPERTWWNHLDNRVFSAADHADVVEQMTQYARPVTPIEVIIPEALSANIAALEIDRCARLLAETVAETISKRSRGSNDNLRLPSTRCAAAWTELMTFTEGYDPFAGVPEEVEDRIAEMLDSVEACAADADLILDRDRPSIRRHLEDWGDRAVDLGFGEERSMRR